MLDVAVSNPQPDAGDSVSVTVEAPFNGTVEVMLVTDKVLSVQQAVLMDRKASVTVEAPEGASQSLCAGKGLS